MELHKYLYAYIKRNGYLWVQVPGGHTCVSTGVINEGEVGEINFHGWEGDKGMKERGNGWGTLPTWAKVGCLVWQLVFSRGCNILFLDSFLIFCG